MPTAVVTGASSGIGMAFARRLAADGNDLVLIARRRERLEQLGAELHQLHGVSADVLEADLTTEEGLRSAEAAVAEAVDLTLLVNNAGFGISGRFFDTRIEDHDRMHRLHVTATMRLTHAALRRMVQAGRGAVINVSSVAGFGSSPGSVSYSATKHWMNNFTEGLWLDLATRKSAVRVQALCPGFTYSEFHDVMKMDRGRIPKAWWTAADDVVEASLRGLEKNVLYVIPGWRYKALVRLSKIVPSAVIRRAAISFARRLGGR
jgi:short-subunit dehydrogenase